MRKIERDGEEEEREEQTERRKRLLSTTERERAMIFPEAPTNRHTVEVGFQLRKDIKPLDILYRLDSGLQCLPTNNTQQQYHTVN